MKKIIAATLLVLVSTVSSQAASICKSYDKTIWMSEADITTKVVAMGYEIRKLGTEGGCYEVKGMKDGKRVEAYFDPTTAELIHSK